MRNNLLSKCNLAILLLLNATTFTSCMIDVDIAPNSTQSPPLPLPSGPYKITGTIYNYNGPVSWAGPSVPIPSGYVSTVDLSLYNPKMATQISVPTIEIAFADLPNLNDSQAYYVTCAGPNFNVMTFDFSGAMYFTQFSNIYHYMLSYIPATVSQKAYFHFMSKYNTLPGGAGNDRIVDEYFEQI